MLSHPFQLLGIPTNVVNPIQQYNHANPRPTNRVLPMQTQPKMASPPHTPPESKPRNPLEPNDQKPIIIHDITIIKNDRVTVTQHSPNSSIILINSKSDGEEEIESFSHSTNARIDDATDGNADNDMFNDKDSDLIDSDSAKDSDSMDLPDIKETYLGGDVEEAFNKLKNDTTVMMIPRNQPEMLCELKADAEAESEICTTEEVKEKISLILDNLEQEAKEKSILENNELFNLPSGDVDAMETVTDMTDVDRKDDLNPTISQDSTLFQKFEKSEMAVETFRPKSAGPHMMYEIQSEDGFTCTSTSINDLWDKVFELVQGARKGHGLTPLPEGPLADMCGYQMVGLKSNAVKYLLEQLPGVENCTNYIPIYHKRAQSTLSQDASSGYCSDYEDLKENDNGAARIEGYQTRSEYDMFSWLASRHRKQPVQLIVQPNLDIESNIR